MRKTRNKEAHNALLRQYIKEIENPDRHGFIGGKWVQSPYKGDDPNNRGYGIDVLQNKDAAKLTQGRQGKWLTEDEERMLRNKHIKDVNKIAKDHFFPYLRKTPLSEEKEIMATGLLYRGDHINGTKLAEPYYNGSNANFQKAVENYYRSKNLNDRAWRSKEFMDAHKSQSPFSTISLESPYVPMEYVGYHPNGDYYYAGELPQVDAYGEHGYADGGMLYGNQDVMPSTPQEDYQQGEQADYQVKPRQWDDLSLSEKNAFIANAVQHGITNMEDIRNAYNELTQEQLNGNDSMDDMEDSHKFLKGGYKPSRYIKNFISHMEGASMKTNRSFDAEAKDFWNALPNNVKGKITQEQADALYSYSYNVGAGNFKNRVVPALERYFNGNGSVEDVQRHMYATKDNQLRGLAKRRAQERAMFAGSEVPVYYNEDYTPQSTNSQWRNSRLGPVTAKSFNISQGLGPVSNTSNTLGPVTSSDYMTQRNKENTEALANILYGSQPMTAFDAPQETTQETSSIDRYNEIQDLLSTPYTFANGGEKDSGVTSTNGLYHASPSEYAGILDSVTNNNPLEVTLPDTTVTVADPSNYRSYYDPNGFMDFANIVTLGTLNRGSVSQDLGLIKDTYDAVRGKKSWKDVGLSAIMGNKGVFNNPYANLALDFAVPVGIAETSKAAKLIASKYDFFRPIREFNVTKPQFEGIINSEKESSAIAPNINSLLLSEDMTNKIAAYANSQKDPLVQIKERMNDPQYAGLIKDNSDRSLSSQEGVKYFEGIDFRDPSTYAKALEKTRNWWNSHTTPYSNLPMSDAIEQEIALNHLPFAAAPSPYVYMPNARTLYYEIPLFSRYPKDINEMMHQYNILKGHETAHIITTPKNNSPLAKGLIPGNYFSKINGTEVSARGTQFKNYFDKNELTADDLKYASEHYVKDTGIDNEITTFFNEVKRQAKSNPSIWQELAKWMSVTSPAIASPIIFNKNNQ